MRVVELKVELDTVVALTLHPRLTVIDPGAPNDALIDAIRCLVSGGDVKMHAVVFEGERYRLRDSDELRALGWTSEAVLLDVEELHGDDDAATADTAGIEASHDGPVADLAAKVASARRVGEAADHAAEQAAEALTVCDRQREGLIDGLKSHETVITDLKHQKEEDEQRLAELSKRGALIAGRLEALAKLRVDPPRTAAEVVAAVDVLDALPAEAMEEIRTAIADWNRPILSTYDLLMGNHQAPSSFEEQFGLAPGVPPDGQIAVAEADADVEPAALPEPVLEHLDKAELTLNAQAERMRDIRATIQSSMDERAKTVTDRQRQLALARAAMLARTGERETLRHQYERALEAATAARAQLADLEVAGRLVHHVARMPSDPVAGRPTLVVEHRSNDGAHRDQLLRTLPVISGETQVVVVTSDATVLDWARRLSSVEGALRSASRL